MSKKLKTTDIKGKPYVEVNERIRYFREHFEGHALETEIVTINDKECVLKAYVRNSEGRVVATGMAREVNGDSFINKTSYIENCETSAWGRALGNFGIGIDTSVASADEVNNAVKQQEEPMKISPHNYEETLGIMLDNVSSIKTVQELDDYMANTLPKQEAYWKKHKQDESLKQLNTALEQKGSELI